MGKCISCNAETDVYDAGSVPICVQCANSPPQARVERAKLFQDLIEATKRAEASTEAFAVLSGNISIGTTHPDGVKRIHDASQEFTAAREEMIKAQSRLNEFLETGIVPEDLKRSG